MCQPKSEGGKRCLKHAKISQFSTRVVRAKTGADDAMISSTMRELSREGKNLPDVSGEDAKSFIELKRFATELDPQLDEHERKIQLNQLEKAKKEVAAGVPGGHMHAWKNILSRVTKKIRKPFVALTLVGTLAFGAAGCAAVTKHTPSPSASHSAGTSATYGDIIGSGKVIKDASGSYEQTTINPNDVSLKYNKSIVEASAYGAGFNDTDLESAQKYVAKFVAEEGTDSIAVDSNAGWAAWQSSKASDYLDPANKNSLLTTIPEGSKGDRSAIIYNDFNGNTPTLVRDGKPRIKTNKITVTAISGGNDSTSGNYVWVAGTAVTEYRVNDGIAITWLKKNNPSVTDVSIKAQAPELYANGSKGETVLTSTFNYGYALLKDGDSWKIAGYKNYMTSALAGNFTPIKN